MIYQQYQTKYVIVNENLLCDHSDTVIDKKPDSSIRSLHHTVIQCFN